MTATSHLFAFMLAAQARDDGKVEVECPECYGRGIAEYEEELVPWRIERRTCERCNGRGTYLREAEDNE